MKEILSVIYNLCVYIVLSLCKKVKNVLTYITYVCEWDSIIYRIKQFVE